MRFCFERYVGLGVSLWALACGSDPDAETAMDRGGAGTGGQAADAGSGGEQSAGAGTPGLAGAQGLGGNVGSGGARSNAGDGGTSGSSGQGGNAGSSVLCEGDDGLDEPNNSEALAAPVCLQGSCNIGDKNGNGTKGYDGERNPISAYANVGDTDFFFYHGKDELFAEVDPTAKTSDTGFRLCMFTACESETKSHSCKKGDPSVSPSGMRGCCVTAPGEVSSDHDCAAENLDDDSATVFIRVDEANACVEYSVDFHF